MAGTVMAQGWARTWMSAKDFSVRPPSTWTGPRIQALRWKYGLSQQQLADVLGVHRVSIGDWESREPAGPRKASICRLLDLLEADPDHLLNQIRE